MPVEALKKTTGAPDGVGSRRDTALAVAVIFRLLNLRTSPRLMRWMMNSRNMSPTNYCFLRTPT